MKMLAVSACMWTWQGLDGNKATAQKVFFFLGMGFVRPSIRLGSCLDSFLGMVFLLEWHRGHIKLWTSPKFQAANPSNCRQNHRNSTSRWFRTFFIFTPIWGNDPI